MVPSLIWLPLMLGTWVCTTADLSLTELMIGLVSSYGGISGSGARTVAAWVKTTYTGDWQTISAWGENAYVGNRISFAIHENPQYYLWVAANRDNIGGWKGGVTDVLDGRWHHVVAVTYAAGYHRVPQRSMWMVLKNHLLTLQAGSVNTATTNECHRIDTFYNIGF